MEKVLRVALFLVPFVGFGAFQAHGLVVVCDPLAGAAPIVDGTVGAGEWPTQPSLALDPPRYPIKTNLYCVYDAANVYILVDAIDDTTNAVWDECLLVFDLPPAHKIVEIWEDDSGIVQRFEGGASGQSAMGFASRRVYEFRIARASLGLAGKRSIPFYSPVQYKSPGVWASMPYDNANGRDNIFPSDLDVTTGDWQEGHAPIVGVSGYATLLLGTSLASVPMLGGWGLASLAFFLAGMGWWLRRKRPVHREATGA